MTGGIEGPREAGGIRVETGFPRAGATGPVKSPSHCGLCGFPRAGATEGADSPDRPCGRNSPGRNPRPAGQGARRRTAAAVLAGVVLTLWGGFPLGADELPPVFLAGSSIREITPAPGSPMSGYGDRGKTPSRGVHDRIYSRCLLLEQDNLRIALVSTELLAFTLEFRAAVAARVRDLDLDLLFLAATHTHSGPGGYKRGWAIERFLMGEYSPALLEYLTGQIAAGVRDACRDLRPARIVYGRGAAPDLVRNRRREGGETDPEAGFLRVEDLAGTPVALVVNFGAHPTVLDPRNLLTSGDYPGMTSALLEKDLGAPVLFFVGTLGDQKPHFPGTRAWEAKTEEQFAEAGKMAAALASEIGQAMEQSAPETVSRFTAGERWVKLPRVDLRARCFLYVFAPAVRCLFRDLFHEETVFQAVRLNEMVLAGLPVEMSAALGRRIKRQTPARVTLLACLANDTLGYALTPEDYRTGGYEACMSFYGRETGTFFHDQALAVIRETWQAGPHSGSPVSQ